MDLTDVIDSFLERYYPEPRHAPLLVAVSGGLDSMVLLDLLAKRLTRAQIHVAHFDHKTRNGASTEDAVWLQTFLEAHGFSYSMGSRSDGLSTSEGSLREARRAFLHEVYRNHSCGAILTAHHADDQFETFVLRLLRGTGFTGLGGMRERDGDWLKPLLTVSRELLSKYARAQKLQYREDGSNRELDYLRNRVRHQLTPTVAQISGAYGGWQSFLRRFTDTMREIGEANEWIQQRIAEEIAENVQALPSMVRFSQSWFAEQPWFTQFAVIRALIAQGGESAERSTIDRVLRGMREGLKEQNVCGLLRLRLSCGHYYLIRDNFDADEFERTDDGFSSHSTGIALTLDDGVREFVSARFFAPGDRLQGKKLSDLLLEARVPAPERAYVPVLIDREGRLLWSAIDRSKNVQITSQYPYRFLSSKTT